MNFLKMYSPVNTNEYDYIDADMDDRDSLYYDTISITGSEPNNRKSLSLSRQTIYHSAVDLPDSATSPKQHQHQTNKVNDSSMAAAAASGYQLTYGGGPPISYRNSAPPNSYFLTNDNYTEGVLNCDKGNRLYGAGEPDETWRRFQDGERSVDFVLAFNGDDTNKENHIKRQIFEKNLENEGLQLEREKTQKVHFVKIHAPAKVLCRYCEILKIRMPVRRLKEQDVINEPELQLIQEIKSFCGRPFQFVKLDPEKFPPKEYELNFEYSRNCSYLFECDSSKHFDCTIRNSVINFILERQRFSEIDSKSPNMGIEKLLTDGVYDSAYPLHDGNGYTAGSQRNLLLTEWASVKKFVRHQPLDNIKEYFGAKIALYFAWLGFYTHMLIPASVVGIFCFLYGLATLSSDSLSNAICNNNKTILMCPQCDAKCDYWYLQETCTSSKFNHIFDNDMTLLFALFMSFWAALYLELWKRYSANLVHRWGLTNFNHQIEHPRPQYLARLHGIKKQKYNYVHQVLEPHVPFWRLKFPSYLMSFSVVILFICLSVTAILSLIVYRMSQRTSHSLFGQEDTMTYKIMVLPVTAGIIDLIVISILDIGYSYLAVFLTNIEYRRTQIEYNESLTIKMYLFQFVNYYSSLFYIAFLKGKFVGYPAKYNRIFGLRQEECNPGGCLMELCVQLVIIMMGKQVVNAIIEMLLPYLIKTYKKLRIRFGLAKSSSKDKLISCNQWTDDYHLLQWTTNSLYSEYLEMVLQYGFVTIFVVAFPLAPLFALLNNIIEMRLDALKLLKFYRKPVAERCKDIGVWYNIMSVVGRIAVGTSAFIIAFSSNLIPKVVYFFVSPSKQQDSNYDQYLNFSLAVFDTKDFEVGIAPTQSIYSNVTKCYYTEFRNPPWDDRPYKRPMLYWQILTFRLAFIVIFQNLVGMIQSLVAWMIPDTPGKLRNRIKREEYLTREIILEHEKQTLKETTTTETTILDNQSSEPRPPPNGGSILNESHDLGDSNTNLLDNGGVLSNDVEIPTYNTETNTNPPAWRRRAKPEYYLDVDRTTPV